MKLYEPYAPDASGRPVPAVVRPAVPADAERIAEIDGQRNGVPPESIVDRIRAHVASARVRDHVLVADVERRLVGFGRVRWIEPDDRYRAVPRGWFLVGTVVDPAVRRGGVGRALLAARLRLVAEEGPAEVFYMANARNLASIELHRAFGFVEITRDFVFPGAEFRDSVGILFGLTPDT
jgi:GNAT superfamily N-acetyltransferase